MAIRPLFAIVLSVSVTSLLPAQSRDRPYIIRNVRVFDGETVAARQTVVISEGKIAAVGDSIVTVPAGAQEISGEGRTLLPGFDAHIHLPFVALAEALQQTLAFGVTTAVVMWAAPPIVSQLKGVETADRPDVAAVIHAGTGATAPGGHPTQMDGGAQARFVPTLSAPGEADAFVAARVAEGSEFIKVIHDDTYDAFGRKLPTLNEETVAALAKAAHARGMIAVAHIGNERYARGAIAAGVDGLAHLFVGPAVSSDFGQLVASRGVFVIPTLSVLYSVCGTPDGPSLAKEADTMRYVKPQFRSALDMPSASSKVSCEAAPQAVRQLSAAGVALLAGTDSPAPGTTYGPPCTESWSTSSTRA